MNVTSKHKIDLVLWVLSCGHQMWGSKNNKNSNQESTYLLSSTDYGSAQKMNCTCIYSLQTYLRNISRSGEKATWETYASKHNKWNSDFHFREGEQEIKHFTRLIQENRQFRGTLSGINSSQQMQPSSCLSYEGVVFEKNELHLGGEMVLDFTNFIHLPAPPHCRFPWAKSRVTEKNVLVKFF